MKALLRALVVLVAVATGLAGVVGAWVLVRPLGWVYALAAIGLAASAVIGAALAARGSALGRWLTKE